MELTDDIFDKLNTVAGRLNGIYQDKECVPEESEYIITLMEIYLFSQLSMVELLSYDNSYKNGESIIEKNTILNHFDLAIGEGISYLCGYGNKIKKSKLAKLLSQKKPDIEHIHDIMGILTEFKEFCEKQNLITVEFKKAKEYSKHYDADIIGSARYLMNICNPQETFRINSYLLTLKILSDCIADFFNSNPVIKFHTSKIIEERTLNCPIVTDTAELPYKKNIQFGERSVQIIWAAVKMLDELKKREACGIITRENATLMEAEIISLFNYAAPMWHLKKVFLDMDYAIKAYVNSKSHLERQSSTYWMLIALYGGFTKLYGISEEEQKNSLMSKYHKVINDCYDITLSSKECKVNKELKKYGIDLKDQFEKVRSILIHSKDRSKDKIVEKYFLLAELCPEKIVEYYARFYNIIRPLREITDIVLAKHYPTERKSYNS